MRTDVKVREKVKVRCPEIPITTAGRPSTVERGDWVEWSDGFRGRMIGAVTNPDDGNEYIVVVMQMLGGCCCERWVMPEDVINTAYGSGSHVEMYYDKASWLYGSQFMYTKPDAARQCFNLTVDDMVKY